MSSITRSKSDVNDSSVRVGASASAELRHANRRLLERRATLHAQAAPTGAGQGASDPAWSIPQALADLPPHLGWDSPALSQALRRSRRDSAEPTIVPSAGEEETADSAEPARLRIVRTPDLPISQSLTTHPSLLLALLKTGHAALGRIWLLCRCLDPAGRGWLALDDLRAALTTPQLPHISWRRLRQILGQGRGVFWEQDNQGRLWLYSAARVAANLGVTRLSGQPITLPLSTLTGSLADFRAHCYAAFHSGRAPHPSAPQSPNLSLSPAPIARATLARLTGIPTRTQRVYDRRAGVRVRPNAALLGVHQPEDYQAAAFQYGRGLFQLCDSQGRHGRPGQTYTARQLPNSYHMPGHRPAARSRRRRLNRQLQDLVTFQAQGNSNQARATRRYLRAAREMRQTSSSGPLYWSTPGCQPTRAVWWYSLENPAA